MFNIKPVNASAQSCNNYERNNRTNSFPLSNLECKKDEATFYKNKRKDDNAKVSFFEGTKLVLSGAGNRIKDMFVYPFKHPIASAVAGIATTSLMCLLPLAGISSAVGAATLGVGFAALSTLNMAKNIKNAVNSYKDNNNKELRKNLKEIGGSCIDMAVSIKPFKKNIINIKNQFKYGKIGFKKDFAKDFKNQKGIFKKLNSLKISNTKINSQINKFAGIDALQKELKFSDEIKQEYLKLYDIKDDKDFLNQAYNRLITDLKYKNNGKNNSPILIFDTSKNKDHIAQYNEYSNSVVVNLENIKNRSKGDILSYLRHELQHFQQYVDIERTKGLGLEKLAMKCKKENNIWAMEELSANANFGGMTPDEIESYKNSFKKVLNHPEAIFAKNPRKEYIDGNWYSNFDYYDPCMFDSKDRYNLFTNIRNVAKKQGVIKPHTKDAKNAKKLFNAAVNYTSTKDKKECKNYFDYFDYFIKRIKYHMNYKEIDAVKHQKVITPVSDKIVINAISGTTNIVNMLSMNKQ